MKVDKFKAGDKVRIVKYGSLYWVNKSMYAEEKAGADALQREIDFRLLFGGEKRFEPIVDPDAKPKNIYSESETIWWCDLMPEIIGKTGIVTGSYDTIHCKGKDETKRGKYSIEGIPGKEAWYDEEQLELVT